MSAGVWGVPHKFGSSRKAFYNDNSFAENVES